jgi:hypothetical protein
MSIGTRIKTGEKIIRIGDVQLTIKRKSREPDAAQPRNPADADVIELDAVRTARWAAGADVSAEIERDLCLIANAGAEAVYLDSRMFLPENTFIGSSFGKV